MQLMTVSVVLSVGLKLKLPRVASLGRGQRLGRLLRCRRRPYMAPGAHFAGAAGEKAMVDLLAQAAQVPQAGDM